MQGPCVRVLGIVGQGLGAVAVHVAVVAEGERDLRASGGDGGALGCVRGGALDQSARLLGLAGGEADAGVADQEVGVVRVQAEALEEGGLGFGEAALGAQRGAQDLEERQERAVLGQAVAEYVDGLGVPVEGVQGGAAEQVRAVIEGRVTRQALELVQGALGMADLEPVAGHLEAGLGRFVHKTLAAMSRIRASATAPPIVAAMPGPQSEP